MCKLCVTKFLSKLCVPQKISSYFGTRWK